MIVRKIKHYIGNSLRKIQIFRYRCFGVEIGENTFISLGAWIDERRGKVIIGHNSAITSGVKILSHDAASARMHPGATGEHITKIGDNVFVGMNAIILPGISVGDNSVIGAGAVVTKDIQPNSLVVGNPGKIIKRYMPENGYWKKI